MNNLEKLNRELVYFQGELKAAKAQRAKDGNSGHDLFIALYTNEIRRIKNQISLVNTGVKKDV